jgi:hypothetical protein
MKLKVMLLILAVLLLAGTVLGAIGLTIPRLVISGGGGIVQEGSFELKASIGQAVVGWTGNGAFDVSSGFWSGMKPRYRIYLPLVLLNAS